MRIFVVCDHEPLPSDPGDRRLMRAGMLTEALASAGHETTWFTSSFDHYRKRQRRIGDESVSLAPNLTARILAAPGYRANVSLARIAHNMAFARAATRAMKESGRPDVVVAAIPATDSTAAAVRFATEQGIPSVVDIYDPWPDSFRQVLSPLRYLVASPVIALLDRQVRRACADATSLVGVSEAYLHWGQRKGARNGRTGADRVFPLSYMPRTVTEGPERSAFLGRLGIGPAHRIVSFVGSWGATHDLQPVLGAATALADRDDVRFVLAGDAESAPEMRAALAALPNVTLPGWLDATEVAMLLSRSDIGLLPYRDGAPQDLPNKVFEYMAYGAYQVGTLRGEAEAVYKRTGAGRAVAANSKALARAIRDVLGDSAIAAGRDARIAAFRSNYSGPAAYALMVEHIEQVARDGVGSSPLA
jgi:hypothetical protein